MTDGCVVISEWKEEGRKRNEEVKSRPDRDESASYYGILRKYIEHLIHSLSRLILGR